MNKLLSDFFEGKLSIFDIQEGSISQEDRFQTLELVHKLAMLPFRNYIQHLNSLENFDCSVSAADAAQYSDFEDVTCELSRTLILAGNAGFTTEEIGAYLLRNKDSKDNKTANTKYGENHIKSGKILGLSDNIKSKWYLTKLGYVFCDLTKNDQEKLLYRLSLRSKLVSVVIYEALRKDVNIVEFFEGKLSASTQVRRKANIRKLFLLVKNNNECDVSIIFDAITGGGFV